MKFLQQTVLFILVMFTTNSTLAHAGHHDDISFMHQLLHLMSSTNLWMLLMAIVVSVYWIVENSPSDK